MVSRNSVYKQKNQLKKPVNCPDNSHEEGLHSYHVVQVYTTCRDLQSAARAPRRKTLFNCCWDFEHKSVTVSESMSVFTVPQKNFNFLTKIQVIEYLRSTPVSGGEFLSIRVFFLLLVQNPLGMEVMVNVRIANCWRIASVKLVKLDMAKKIIKRPFKQGVTRPTIRFGPHRVKEMSCIIF
ncbi:hypothetical protein HUJ04_011080 [Dendroctonus ponderosae]|nr:hypothetical protein HUJ04_011080 [Dendroctonus ponderosae]